jgi:hypothetical protein
VLADPKDTHERGGRVLDPDTGEYENEAIKVGSSVGREEGRRDELQVINYIESTRAKYGALAVGEKK